MELSRNHSFRRQEILFLRFNSISFQMDRTILCVYLALAFILPHVRLSILTSTTVAWSKWPLVYTLFFWCRCWCCCCDDAPFPSFSNSSDPFAHSNVDNAYIFVATHCQNIVEAHAYSVRHSNLYMLRCHGLCRECCCCCHSNFLPPRSYFIPWAIRSIHLRCVCAVDVLAMHAP